MKKLTGYLLVASVCIVMIVVGIKYKQSLDKDNYYSKHDIKYGVKIVSHNAEHVANSRREAYIAQTKLLRNKWRPWAFAHKDLLNKMVASQPDQESVLNEVYMAMPSLPREIGINQTDLVVPGIRPISDITSAGEQIVIPNFDWYGFKPKPQKFPSVNAEKNYKKDRASFRTLILGYFRTFHDVPVCTSVSGASSAELTLWASGRITEATYSEVVTDENPLGEGSPVELAPTFDFLH